jgi:hypothetical protein
MPTYQDKELITEEKTRQLIQESKINIYETTYNNLVTLRKNKQLIPGTQYMITDYNFIADPNSNIQSGNHAFAIIVTADSTDTLNENARAALQPISYQ